MKKITKTLWVVVIAIFILCAFTLAAAEEESAEQLTDEQKMAEVRGYFESKYQEVDYFRADRLLITATGSMKPVHKAPSVATVITAEDIEKMGAATWLEALQTVPGLYMSEYYIAGTPLYSFRGIHTALSPQVLLQINGLPVKYIFQRMIPFGLHIPVSNISRIEVVRGPGSAVHGADAFSGVINVITKDGQEVDGIQTGLRYGSFDTMEAWFMHGGSYGGWEVMASINYHTTDGDGDRIIDSDLQTVLDTSLNNAFGLPPASLAPGPVQSQEENLDMRLSLVRDNWSLRFWGSFQDDSGFGVGLTPALDTYGTRDTDLLQADITYENNDLLTDTDLSARFSYQYIHSDSIGRMFPPGALMPIGQDGNLFTQPMAGFALFTEGVFGQPIIDDHQPALDLTALYKGISDHMVRLGGGVRYIKEETDNYKNFGPGVIDTDELLPLPAINEIDGMLTHLTNDSPYIFMNNQDRTIWYGSIQDVWTLAPKWELTAGVRYDHYSDFGGTTNPRLALVWETMPQLTSKILYGTAFSAPGFAELYLVNNPSALGNPDLDPETIQTLELAFDYQPMNIFRTNFNVFYYEIEDLIELVPDEGVSTLTSQNSRDQEGYGFELEADWQITQTFQLRGNVAYQHSEDKNTSEIVADAPAWQTYLNGHWAFIEHWSLDAQWFWIGDRSRAEGDPRPDIDNYSLVNLTLRRKNIAKRWDVALLVKNLFDEDIYESTDIRILDDYPMEGRSILGELRLYF